MGNIGSGEVLVILVLGLATEKPLSRHTIRERIPGAYSENDESFRRTFERDKDELRALGLPISVERIPGTDPPLEGYRIHQSEYEADHPLLDPEEIAALHLASNLVHLEGDDLDSPFYKMGGVLQGKATTLSEIPSESLIEVGKLILLVESNRDTSNFFSPRRPGSLRKHRLENAQKINQLRKQNREILSSLDQEKARNGKLTDTLESVRDQVLNLRHEIENLSKPPSAYGTIVKINDEIEEIIN